MPTAEQLAARERLQKNGQGDPVGGPKATGKILHFDPPGREESEVREFLKRVEANRNGNRGDITRGR